MSAPDSFFDDFIASVAPDDGDIVMFLKSYFDESYDSDILCVAGYTFTSAKARSFNDDWRKMLARYKRLPYFRMSACNSQKPPFDRLTEAQCVSAATEAIALIHKFAEIGYAVAVDKKAFNSIVSKRGVVSTPYELCSFALLILSRTRMTLREGKDFTMSFFFEAGFQDQGPANSLMQRIARNPQWKSLYGYKAHAFLDKMDCGAIQAADLLAWQWYKDANRRVKWATSFRGDLAALLKGTRHYVIHLNNESLQEFVYYVNERAKPRIAKEIADLAFREAYEEIKTRFSTETKIRSSFIGTKSGRDD